MYVHDRPPAIATPPLAAGMDRIVPQRPVYNAPMGGASLPSHQPSQPDPPVETGQSYSDNQGRTFSLEVVQQPVRARMCGFGDKDRRPITPPPCVRLVIKDTATGAPIDIKHAGGNPDSPDIAFFVLSVDLWSADGTKEVNLVRHSATSPSISATTSSSYPPPPTPPVTFPYGVPMTQVHTGLANNYAQANHSYPYGARPGTEHYPQSTQQPYAHPHAAYNNPPGAPALEQPPLNSQSYYTTPSGAPITPTGYYAPGQGPLMSPSHLGMPPTQDPRSAPSGMFTRNLIGSLCVSAFRLQDPDGTTGIWFILQDLSVRTEGSFKLKMSFVNVGENSAPGNPPNLNTSSAPILATTFSQDFHVFSAKKFPGVIESTPLSKCFATQGIKIPIRKDGPGRREDEDD